MINLNTRISYIETGNRKCLEAKRNGNHWIVKLFRKGRMIKTIILDRKKDVLKLAKEYIVKK